MKKLLTIIGARPQIIKAAAFSRAVKTNFNSELVEYIVHTGQHYDKELSQVFIDQLEVPEPHKNLGVRAGSHASQLAAMVEKIETQIIAIKPQAVLVYGDTNSTLAGALAASKMNIPIIHIEAGLRSFNKRMPEEINRITTDHVSTFLFSPTKTGLKNLEKEGFNLNTSPPFSINNPAVFHTGDIMYDNSLHFSAGNVPLAIISDLELTGQRYILATIHRPSNTDFKEPLERILSALMNESKERNIKIILPLHPRTRERIDTFFLNTEFRTKLENHAYLKLISPCGFLEMIELEKNCELVITDSGGVQKEAFFFKKPSLILREETEWVEIIEAGCGALVGSSPELIHEGLNRFLAEEARDFPQIFGDGKAAEFICEQILNYL